MSDRRAFLTILGRERRITVGDDLLIGRDAECGLRLAKDPKVSRKHCRISQIPDGFLLIDLESQNGLLVNGAKIHKCILQPGDVIPAMIDASSKAGGGIATELLAILKARTGQKLTTAAEFRAWWVKNGVNFRLQ